VTDKAPTKIPISELDELERLLDETPTCEVTAISKLRAIERLTPKLYAMHAKGYSWHRIAEWLTAHGLGVTRATLQGYVRRVRDAPPGDAGRSSKQRGARAPRAAPAKATLTSAPAPRRDTPASGAAVNAVEPAPDKPSRRSAFVPRPDSDEI